MNYQSRTVIITGASSGIGREFARLFAAEGARLVLTGRRETVLEEARHEAMRLGAASVELIVGDLADPRVASTVEAVAGEPGLAALINNAGFSHYSDVADSEPEPLLGMLTVQAEVPVRLCRTALRSMGSAGSGLIINVGSLAGRVAVPGSALYVATKCFLERFSETLALEAARRGVVVQALTPGYVRTDFHRNIENYRQKRKNRGLIRWMDADAVVRRSMRAADRAHRRLRSRPDSLPRRRDVIIIPGAANRLLAALSPLVPRSIVYRAAAARPRM